jgi:hypothetical protein
MATLKGGTKLDAALSAIAAKISRPAMLKVGFLSGAAYPDGTSVALVAAVNEYGSPSRGIPPRPFFRGMIAEKSSGWPAAVATNLKAKDYDVDATLRIVGEGIKGQLQTAITEFSGVPLAPATVAAKGSTKQLVDTAQMLNSVDYTVDES